MTSTPARAGIALAVLALAVQLALTRPWRREAGELSAQHQRLLDQQRQQRHRLADLEARAALRASAVALVGRSAATSRSDAVLHRVRTGVVSALDPGVPSRLEVRSGPAPAVATVALSTAGDFATVVDLAATLARPGSGLVFRRVSLRRGSNVVDLQVEAAALGGGT